MLNGLTLYAFVDASFGNVDGGSTQAGGIIFLGPTVDYLKGITVNVITWFSRKIRRVVRSTFSGETLALIEMLDLVLYVKYLI